VERLCASNTKARKLLNWKPKNLGKKGLITGLTKTVKWFEVEKNFKKYRHDIYNL